MWALHILVFCTLSYASAIEVFIDSPVVLLDCRTHVSEASVGSKTNFDSTEDSRESTAKSHTTEELVDPKELFDAAHDGDLSFINATIKRMSTSSLDLNWHNPNHNKYTALHIATEKDHPSIVAALLDAGADPDVQDGWDLTPMHLAAWNNHVSVLRILLDHKYQANVNLQDIKGRTPVFVATAERQTGALELLLSHGADPNKEDNSKTPIAEAAYRGLTDALEQLLAHGGDPNKVIKDGLSPLQSASYYSQVESVKMLIQAGANVNYVHPGRGRTALHWAAMKDIGGTSKSFKEIPLILLQNGADKNVVDKDGDTPADVAGVAWGDEVGLLIKNY